MKLGAMNDAGAKRKKERKNWFVMLMVDQGTLAS